MLTKAPPTAKTGTLVSQVIGSVKSRIAGRTLMPGARLPSVRDLAGSMGVSKSTIVDAYERLVAEGTITARRGSGFYVAGPVVPLSLKAIGPELDRSIDPLWITRQSLQASPDALRPGSGWLPSSWLPDTSLQRGIRQLARDGIEHRTQYDEPLGYAPLRQVLARRMIERGIAVDTGQIVITDSASQSLDLLCRFLLGPGDTVLVDDPCYFNFHALLRAQRVKVVGVPYTRHGTDLDAFEAALIAHRPRFYLTNAGPQNPTGATLTPTNAHRLLKLAEAHDILIIEDDVFADFEHEPMLRLAGFDGFDRVIQLGSFSKTISASIRCGFIAVKPEWIEPLVDLKLAIYLGNGRLSAVLLHHLLTDGTHRRFLDNLRGKLSTAMGQAVRRLTDLGLEPYVEPRDGLFLWARLPDGGDAADVAKAALVHNVILAPGNVFSVSHTATRYLRFNVAHCNNARVFDVLTQAMTGQRRNA